jgi:hypothetical protein
MLKRFIAFIFFEFRIYGLNHFPKCIGNKITSVEREKGFTSVSDK